MCYCELNYLTSIIIFFKVSSWYRCCNCYNFDDRCFGHAVGRFHIDFGMKILVLSERQMGSYPTSVTTKTLALRTI